MPTRTETVDQLFDYAIELEKASETLYRQMGEMFAHNHDIEQYWKHYADEEHGHASYLERIKGALDTARLSTPADSQIMQDAQRCLELASQKRLAGVQNLDDAYQLAVELENSEINAIFEFMIMNFSTDELAKSNKFLRSQLSSHVARLETELPTRYRSSAARRNLTVSR